MKNVSIISDFYRMKLLNLPKNADDVYYLNGVLHTGEPPVNELPEGVTLSYQTKNGRAGEANFRITASKIYADGDYFGKTAEAYEDIYESSEENAKLLRTKKQVVSNYYGGARFKSNSVIKDGSIVASAVREDDNLGNIRYTDMHGNRKVSRYTYHSAIPLEVIEQRRIYSKGRFTGQLRKLIMKLCNDANGCERPYIRKLGGLLFR